MRSNWPRTWQKPPVAGFIQSIVDYEPARRTASVERAVRLNPGSFDVQHAYSGFDRASRARRARHRRRPEGGRARSGVRRRAHQLSSVLWSARQFEKSGTRHTPCTVARARCDRARTTGSVWPCSCWAAPTKPGRVHQGERPLAALDGGPSHRQQGKTTSRSGDGGHAQGRSATMRRTSTRRSTPRSATSTSPSAGWPMRAACTTPA